MGKKRRKTQEVNSKEPVDNGSNKNGCPHVDKSIGLNQVKKSKSDVCESCLKLKEQPNVQVSGPWICLKCGVKSCSREHGLAHYKVPRSTCHALVINISDNNVWCYTCEAQVPASTSKKLKSCITDLEYMKNVNIKLTDPIAASARCTEKENSTASNINQKFLNIKKGLDIPGVVGLINEGSTCYANSVLQCLTRTPKLEEAILSDFDNPVQLVLDSGQEVEFEITRCDCDRLIEEYLKFHRTLTSKGADKVKVSTAVAILRELTKRHPHFMWDEQHDAHEFLRLLLDTLRTIIHQSFQNLIMKEKNLLTPAMRKNVSPELKKELKDIDKKLCQVKDFGPEKVFGGQLVSRLQCKECGSSSESIEKFMDLSLPVLTTESELTPLRKKGGQGVSDPSFMKGSKMDSYVSKPKSHKERRKERKERRDKLLLSSEDYKNSNDSESCANGFNYNGNVNSDDANQADNELETSEIGALLSSDELKTEDCGFKTLTKNSAVGNDAHDSPIDKQILETSDKEEMKEDIGFQEDISSELTTYNSENINLKNSKETQCDQEISMKNPSTIQPEQRAQEECLIENGKEAVSMKGGALMDNLCNQFSRLTAETPKSEKDEKTQNTLTWMNWSPEKHMDAGKWTSSEEWWCENEEANQILPPICCNNKHCPSVHAKSKTIAFEDGIPVISSMVFGGGRNSSVIQLTDINLNNIKADIIRKKVDDYFEVGPDGFTAGSKKLSQALDYMLSNFEMSYDPQSCRKMYPPSNVPLEMSDRVTSETEFGDLSTSKIPSSGYQCNEAEDREVQEAFFYNNQVSKDCLEIVGEKTTFGETLEAMSNGGRESDDGLCISNLYDMEEFLEQEEMKITKVENENYNDSSIEKCLQEFIKEEILTGSNKVGCTECTARANKGNPDGKTVYTTFSKQLLIKTVPEIVILHLKRFQVQMSSIQKVNRQVSFPIILDMAPFCSQAKVHKSKNILYHLFGVVKHSGGINGGHYEAYVAQFDKDAFIPNGSGETCKPKVQWYRANDRNVTVVTEEQVLSTQAYLLFYRRIPS
ncbi:ubiquitin carboxyl-terminal hydrolase 16 isoform X1 [Cimex lectularius]|uniref:Ubiquitinyl hydrolase 1 n=1 Tax=Cimex lectularius TaxID=79782 RepID=A0A8I6RKF2_CIMLE|nr:ubiquitin carboxyl-terminal hydrolase 16 isoform X1 [Cimex lectularius]